MSEVKPIISYDDFNKIDLRTAVVLEASPVPDADKLLLLKVSLGTEERQIVAGVKQHYAPESLVGKTIIIVANLAPRKLRGIESHGMLLAASFPIDEGVGNNLSLITTNNQTPPGVEVH